MQDIDYFASKVNKLKIVRVNDERKLYKENKEVSILPLKEAMSQFLAFVSQSVGRAKSHANKNVSTVLLGHKEVSILPLKEAMSQFLAFVSQSVGRAKSHANKNVSTVLLGHRSLIFDVPVQQRNC